MKIDLEEVKQILREGNQVKLIELGENMLRWKPKDARNIMRKANIIQAITKRLDLRKLTKLSE